MRKQNNINPSELFFSASELSKNVNYVKLMYTDLDEEIHEIDTKVKFIGDRLISLYFTTEKLFDITYPQEIGLKFITENALFAAKAILQEMKRTDNTIFFTILPPKK